MVPTTAPLSALKGALISLANLAAARIQLDILPSIHWVCHGLDLRKEKLALIQTGEGISCSVSHISSP